MKRPDKVLIGATEIANALGLSVKQVKRMARGGTLPTVRVGNRMVASRKELQSALKASQEANERLFAPPVPPAAG